MTHETDDGSVGSETEADPIERLADALRDWRTRIDDLKVHLDLAAMDAKDTLDKEFEVAQNAYLAARSRLSQPHDLGSDLKTVGHNVEAVLRDLKEAFDAVKDVVRRSRRE
jgi:hypothetical protein